LEQKYRQEIDREPYMATFSFGTKNFTIATMHAIPTAKNPETELKYLKEIPAAYPGKNLIFCGDFNLSQSNKVFTPLKNLGYPPVLQNQKTSLKRECKAGECLASEYDNIFYDSRQFKTIESGVVHFYKQFATLKEAQAVSDHIPVYLNFSLN
jgi:exonuclease III